MSINATIGYGPLVTEIRSLIPNYLEIGSGAMVEVCTVGNEINIGPLGRWQLSYSWIASSAGGSDVIDSARSTRHDLRRLRFLM